MNSHARNRMPTLAALLLIALLALIAASRPAAATLAPARCRGGGIGAATQQGPGSILAARPQDQGKVATASKTGEPHASHTY
jgi:hypothetical protein